MVDFQKTCPEGKGGWGDAFAVRKRSIEGGKGA